MSPRVVVQVVLTYWLVNMSSDNWQSESKSVIFTGTSEESTSKMKQFCHNLFKDKNHLMLKSTVRYSNKEILIF